MTVEIYPAPTGAVTSYTSRRYYVSCNGTSLFVYGTEQVGTNSLNGSGTTLEPSFVKIGTTETVTFTIQKRVAGTATIDPITTAALYPPNVGTLTVTGGSATVVAPANTQLFLVTNGDWANPLCLFADPLKPAIPAGSVDYTTLGSPTSIAAGVKLYFPPGLHTIGGATPNPLGAGTILFKVNSGCKVYIDGGAIVEGNFDVSGTADTEFLGAGVQSGATNTWAAVQTLSFLDQVKFAPFYRSAFAFANSVLRGIVSTRNPFYGSWFATTSYSNYHIVNPWFGNCDGFSAFSAGPDASAPYAFAGHCFILAGDAGVTVFDPSINYVITNCFAITGNNAAYLFNYWASPPSTKTTTFTNCVGMQLGIADSGNLGPPAGPGPFPYLGGNATIAWFCDGRNDQPTYGRSNVTFTNFTACGPMASRLFAIINAEYPSDGFGAYHNDAAGQTANWVFDGLTCETLPGQRALLLGRDFNATPCGFYFSNFFIAGTEVTAVNWDTFVEMNEAPYFVFIGGREVVTVVDIVNLALTNIGQSARVSSVAPADGSAEAELAALRYSQEVNKLLMRHKWAFATRSHTLVAVTGGETTRWAYCYALPASFLAFQAVLPPGVTESDRGLAQAQFAVEQDASGTQRLYTNIEVATLVYTSTVTNPNLFTPQFIEALSWALGAVMAGSLIKGDPGMAAARRCLEMVEFTLRSARETDAELRNVEVVRAPSYLEARQ